MNKFEKIFDKLDKAAIEIILDEYGSWTKFAFVILESIIYDKIKYNDISYMITKEKEYGYKIADAQSLGERLQELKKEFLGETDDPRRT